MGLAVAKRWLASPRAPWGIVALGLLLVSPALDVGFATDDHLHRILSRDDPGITGFPSRPLDLFVFTSGRADNQALMDAGVFPWWTHRDAKLAFMRPFASLSHAIDHWLWPESARLAQAHGLFWFALSLLALWAVYARLFEARWAAALALLLYAVDDARGPTVGWIANRNATIAFALALPVLLLHVRAREKGRLSWFAPLWLALALSAGESALAIVAYLAAYALWLDPGSWQARSRSLASYLGVIVLWRLAYVKLGYGVASSGVYVDPGADPGGFVALLVQRLPLLLGAQLGGPWSDLAGLYPFLGPSVPALMLATTIAALALLAWLAWPLFCADALSRFFATGMLLAAVPICSTFPADRLLTFVGIGGMGLCARFFQHALGELAPARRLTRVAAPLLALVLLGLSPPLLALRAHGMADVEAMARRTDAGLPHDPAVQDKTLVLAAVPGDPFVGYLLITRASLGLPRPAALRWLATGLSAVTLVREDARTLLVRPEGGFLQFEMDRMLRAPVQRFRVGERVVLRGMTVEVRELTPDGRPLAVAARFDHPLEAASYVWRRWAQSGLVPYRPPAVGAREVLPAIQLLDVLASAGGQP